MRHTHPLDISETSASRPWREALSAFNPLELWHAFQEAEDAVCLMAPPPQRPGRPERDDA
jgi:hypothetical protein